MAKPEHLKILKEGVEAWNKWRGKNAEVGPDLSRADLLLVNLGGGRFAPCQPFPS